MKWFLSLAITTLSLHAYAQEEAPPFECDNNYGACGTPNMSGGGGGGGGGSVLIAFTDLGDTYQNADDFDDDGIEDPQDNCPRVANLDQLDQDGDGFGDMCDNCLVINNPKQINKDGDAFGDLCDDDDDGDLIDDVIDNCPKIHNLMVNGKQPDLDNDGIGDACDDDLDGDSIPNSTDSCPMNRDITNPSEGDIELCFPDRDGDGVFDISPREGGIADNCPSVHNPNQLNTDGDKWGDLCDNDDDGDEISDLLDNCPLISNAIENGKQLDADRDGLGDACDDRFCYVAFGDEANCLDPLESLQAYSPSFLVNTGESVRLRLFANRENQELEYSWRVVSAPEGASRAVVNARGTVKVSTPYEYHYEKGFEATFSPNVAGEYEIEVSITTVGADESTGEVNATSTFTSRLVAQGVSSSNSCAQSSSMAPQLLLLLAGLFLLAARRRRTA